MDIKIFVELYEKFREQKFKEISKKTDSLDSIFNYMDKFADFEGFMKYLDEKINK